MLKKFQNTLLGVLQLRIRNKMIKTSKNLLGIIKRLEKIDFPEFKNEDIMLDSNIYSPEGRYCYFSPSWHFKRKLVTSDILKDLRQNNKRILSVGSGPAYLERFLVRHFSIKPGQIVLSDIHDKNIPEGFEKYIFDMNGKWPEFKDTFDYVIFPESFTAISTIANTGGEIKKCLLYIFNNALRVTNPGGQIRGDGHCQIPEYIETVENFLQVTYPGTKIDYTGSLVVVKKPCEYK